MVNEVALFSALSVNLLLSHILKIEKQMVPKLDLLFSLLKLQGLLKQLCL